MKHPFPAFLSILFPGAGHYIKGEGVVCVIVWFACTFLGYLFFIIPGVCMHLNCIRSAYNDGAVK